MPVIGLKVIAMALWTLGLFALLPLGMSSILGIRSVFLDRQLFDGSGDLFLPPTWRISGAVESIIGVLMCGLSVSFIFALIMGLVEREARFSSELAWMTGKGSSTGGVSERPAFEPAARDREGHL